PWYGVGRSIAGAATMLVIPLLVAAFFLGSLLMQRLFGMSALRTGLAFLPVATCTVARAHLACPPRGTDRATHRRHPRPARRGRRAGAADRRLRAGLGLDRGRARSCPRCHRARCRCATATTTALATVDESLAGVTSARVNTAHELVRPYGSPSCRP